MVDKSPARSRQKAGESRQLNLIKQVIEKPLEVGMVAGVAAVTYDFNDKWCVFMFARARYGYEYFFVIVWGIGGRYNALMNTKQDTIKIRNTARKDEFARLVFGGMSKAKAYRLAFGKPDMSVEASRKAGNRLSHDGYVLEKIKSLSEHADMDAIISKHERMVILSRKIRECDESGDTNGLIKCIELLNRMDGAYAPAKVEVSGDIVKDFVRAQIERASEEPLVRGVRG